MYDFRTMHMHVIILHCIFSCLILGCDDICATRTEKQEGINNIYIYGALAISPLLLYNNYIYSQVQNKLLKMCSTKRLRFMTKV